MILGKRRLAGKNRLKRGSTMTDSTRDLFDALARVLLRCWICGYVLLFVWAGAFASHVIHKLHGPLMRLSDHELDLLHYGGMGFLKLMVLILFFIPWLSIKLVLRKRIG
jgi:hypothetical protein